MVMYYTRRTHEVLLFNVTESSMLTKTVKEKENSPFRLAVRKREIRFLNSNVWSGRIIILKELFTLQRKMSRASFY